MLRLPSLPTTQLTQAVVAGYPRETCGLLVGRLRDGVTEVCRAVPARNRSVQRAHDRYDLDPDDFRRADEAARADELEIVGIWHSHPDHAAEPSETDREAAWEGWSYLIARVTQQGVTDLRSWRLQGDRFVEEDIEETIEEGRIR
jgi:proteasome lid subunit RPN8/RPN11